MASKFYNGGMSKQYRKTQLRRQTESLVPRIYACIAACLWDRGWESDQIQELFKESEERWDESIREGWDMLENVAEVANIDVRHFRQTGNIVGGDDNG